MAWATNSRSKGSRWTPRAWQASRTVRLSLGKHLNIQAAVGSNAKREARAGVDTQPNAQGFGQRCPRTCGSCWCRARRPHRFRAASRRFCPRCAGASGAVIGCTAWNPSTASACAHHRRNKRSCGYRFFSTAQLRSPQPALAMKKPAGCDPGGFGLTRSLLRARAHNEVNLRTGASGRRGRNGRSRPSSPAGCSRWHRRSRSPRAACCRTGSQSNRRAPCSCRTSRRPTCRSW